jgi:hypothetical protein
MHQELASLVHRVRAITQVTPWRRALDAPCPTCSACAVTERWGETDLTRLSAVEQDEGDVDGPVGLGVAVEVGGPVEEAADDGALTVLDDDAAAATPTPVAASSEQPAPARSGRLVVFGDSDFAANAQLAAVGNPTLLLNAMNWLVARENLLAIPPKKAEQIQLNLTRSNLGTIYLLVLVAMPLASAVAGVVVYLRRRR